MTSHNAWHLWYLAWLWVHEVQDTCLTITGGPFPYVSVKIDMGGSHAVPCAVQAPIVLSRWSWTVLIGIPGPPFFVTPQCLGTAAHLSPIILAWLLGKGNKSKEKEKKGKGGEGKGERKEKYKRKDRRKKQGIKNKERSEGRKAREFDLFEYIEGRFVLMKNIGEHFDYRKQTKKKKRGNQPQRNNRL